MTDEHLWAYVPDRGAPRRLALVTLVDAMGTGLFLAGAVLFFVRTIGLAPAQVGLGLSIAGAVAFVTTVPLGVVGDRLGPRRLLVLVQLWHAACLVALVFVSDIVWFTVVASLLSIADRAGPPLMQTVVARAVDDGDRVRNMAILRSIRNVGFSMGALLAAPLLVANSTSAFRAIMLGDALSFVVATVILTHVPLRQVAVVRRSSLFGTAPASFRDRPYVRFTALNSVLTLHITLLALGIPLWLISATSAPAALVAVLLLVNTMMVVVLQVPLSQPATVSGGASRMLRLAGLMLAACSLSLAVAAHVGPWVAVLLLALATALMTMGEIWQTVGAWELAHLHADPERQAQYLSVFSLSIVAQDIFGPVLVTGAVIGAGTAGWLGLAGLFLVATALVGPTTAPLQRPAPTPD